MTERQWYPCLSSSTESLFILHGKNTDPLEKPSSVGGRILPCTGNGNSSLLRSEPHKLHPDIRKKRTGTYSLFSPHLEALRKFNPNNQTQLLKLIYWWKPPGFGTGGGSTTCSPGSTHPFASLQEPWGRALPAQACTSQQAHPGCESGTPQAAASN